ncbi:hypothetical protein Mapa_007114 [Marchantia paleacea]|nr:hypothetical protein Mapa_007114 [Marchantia paleacea]
MAQLAVVHAAASAAAVSCTSCVQSRRLNSSLATISGRSAPRLDFCWNRRVRTGSRLVVRAVNMQEKEDKGKEKEKKVPDVESTTQKWGLEAGLWQIFTSKEEGEEGKEKKKNQAKELLTRYGSAYLATSITLSLVSFSLCYVLVNSGVDVPSLLEKVGIHTNETGEKLGTFALAYAAHKAASPIRFPPTVALTPIVAGWFGKKPTGDDDRKA